MPIKSNDRFQMKMKAVYISLRGLPCETDLFRFIRLDSEYVQLVKNKSKIPITKLTKRRRRILAMLIFERMCLLGWRRTPNKEYSSRYDQFYDPLLFSIFGNRRR